MTRKGVDKMATQTQAEIHPKQDKKTSYTGYTGQSHYNTE